MLRRTILTLALCAAPALAVAQEGGTPANPPGEQPVTRPAEKEMTKPTSGKDVPTAAEKSATKPTVGQEMAPVKPAETTPAASDVPGSGGDVAAEMERSQQAMNAILSATQALDAGDRAKAKDALDEAETRLRPLYDTPPLGALLNEIEEAIASIRDGRTDIKPIDLAPLAGIAREQKIYLDPDAYADLAQAEKYAREKNASAAADKLRLARERIGTSVAFLPVEEAYLRVLAARALVDTGDLPRARRLIGSLPVLFADVRVSAPLVPVRFDLQAAAAAADEKNWSRAATLLYTARTRLDGVIRALPDASTEDLAPLLKDVDRMQQQATGKGAKPKPAKIRDLAKRVRDATLG